ncbi:MAG: protein kinase [Chloroflexota bacterium]
MIPEKIERYLVTSEIGRGGMATVFRAHDPRFDRDVAIKVLPKEFLHDPQFRERFEREAKTIALLEHPAIVPVYDFGEFEGQPYLVMRLMEGGSLTDRLKEEPLTLGEALEILDNIGNALDAAHKKGIIHRDLKPGNILFDQYGEAYLSDFGIARMTESDATLTGSKIIGTPAYMSPEQVDARKDLDGRADIYSLGVLLYQMLTSKLPFHADTAARVMMMHLLEPVPDVSTTVPTLPKGCDAVIFRAMAKNRDERYSTSAELIADLRAVLAEQPLPSIEKTIARKRVEAPARKVKNVWLIAGGGLGVLLLVLGIIFAPRFLGDEGKQLLAAVAGASPTVSFPTATIMAPLVTTVPVAVQATNSPTPTETQPPTPTPSLTAIPTDTLTPTPEITVIGGADKIAFLNDDDNIWIVDVDGKNLRQLTTDGNANKSNFQWVPDGSRLIYIEGRCMRSVTLEGVSELITCFDAAQQFDGLAISPDGTQIGLSIDRILYVLPFDLEQLKSVSNHNHLAAMSTFGSYCRSVHEAVIGIRWSLDGTLLELKVKVPGSDGRLSDVIRLMRVSTCNQDETDRLNEIPGQQFTLSYYRNNPIIPSFDWDGESILVFHDFFRNEGYGNLYAYNTETRQLVNIGGNTILNPIEGKCCYRDAHWSPDGTYLAFVFQNIDTNQTQLYYVRFGLLGSQSTFEPIPLEGMLQNPRVKPQPVPHPAP